MITLTGQVPQKKGEVRWAASIIWDEH